MAKKYFRIDEILEAKGKTRLWLAEKLEVSPVTITRYITNVRQPSMETLELIAKALGVKLKDLIND